MDHEFDLREYVAVITRRWRLILSLAVIAAAVAGLVTWLRPPLYEGKAALSVAKGQFTWGFGSGIGNILDAKSDLRKEVDSQVHSLDVARLVIQRLGEELPPDRRDARALARSVRGRAIRNSFSDYDLVVADRDPHIAALLANAYAEVVAERMENLYGLGDITAALEKAVADLEEAEGKKAEFQARTGLELGMGSSLASTMDDNVLYSGLSIKKQQLVLKNAALADYRESRERLELVLAYAEQAQAAGKGVDALPLELLRTPILTARGRVTPEALAFHADDLSGLIAALRAEWQAIGGIQSQLQEQAANLQASLAQDQVEYDRLERDRRLKEETVFNLTRKKQELRAKQLVEGPLVTVAAPATIPEKPAGLPPLLVAAIGILVGGLAGILLALVLEALRVAPPAAQPTPSRAALG
jgi:capsular polysaccharide biosynthesis protein